MAIQGVIVHLKDSNHRGAEKYERHSVIPSDLTSTPYLWHIPTLLNLNLLIAYISGPPPAHNPRAGYEFFFFTKQNPMAASSLVLFRKDLKPLHPKHAQALWKFLKHIKKMFLPTAGSQAKDVWKGLPKHQLRDEYSDRVWTLGDYWKDYCTMNNFSAFFDLLRYEKLMEGDESWRFVRSPYA